MLQFNISVCCVQNKWTKSIKKGLLSRSAHCGSISVYRYTLYKISILYVGFPLVTLSSAADSYKKDKKEKKLIDGQQALMCNLNK